MDRYRSRIAIVAYVPNFIQQLASREHLIRMAGKQEQHIEFFNRQINLFALNSHDAIRRMIVIPQ